VTNLEIAHAIHRIQILLLSIKSTSASAAIDEMSIEAHGLITEIGDTLMPDILRKVREDKVDPTM
jgi:hypothetical protein